MAQRPRLQRFFARVIALRVPILVLYALLVTAAAVLAARIPSEGAISGLVVGSDPDYAATRAFQRIFPEGQLVMLLLEADDPWRPEVLAEADAVAAAAGRVRGVTVISALDVYRKARPGFAPTPEGAAAFRAFATGADLFRKQGLVGDRFLGLAVAFPTAGPASRDATLAALDAAIAAVPRAAVREVRKVGAPYVESWIERESGQA